jgi:hypothetical protein
LIYYSFFKRVFDQQTIKKLKYEANNNRKQLVPSPHLVRFLECCDNHNNHKRYKNTLSQFPLEICLGAFLVQDKLDYIVHPKNNYQNEGVDQNAAVLLDSHAIILLLHT